MIEASATFANMEAPSVSKCEVCMGAVSLMDTLIGLNYTIQEMIKPAVDFCNRFVFPHSEHPMCPGIVAAYAPSVVEVILGTVATPSEICSMLRVRSPLLGAGPVRMLRLWGGTTCSAGCSNRCNGFARVVLWSLPHAC